jgi:flagellar protein FliJ
MYPRGTLKRVKNFQIQAVRRKMAQIGSTIDDFELLDAELAREIKSIEIQSGISDPTNFSYSLIARAVMQRRENLRRSADELRKGLGETRQTLSEALIELEQMLWAEERRQEGLALNEVRDNAET